MARLNPRRRRLAAQERLLREITLAHGRAHDDSHLLQQGRVRSSMDKFTVPGCKGANQVRMGRLTGITCAPAWYRDGASLVYQGDK